MPSQDVSCTQKDPASRWFRLCLIAALCMMGVAALAHFFPRRLGPILLVGVLVFFWFWVRNPEFWYRRMATTVLGMWASIFIVRGVSVVAHWNPDGYFFLRILMGNVKWPEHVLLGALLALLLVLDFRSQPRVRDTLPSSGRRLTKNRLTALLLDYAILAWLATLLTILGLTYLISQTRFVTVQEKRLEIARSEVFPKLNTRLREVTDLLKGNVKITYPTDGTAPFDLKFEATPEATNRLGSLATEIDGLLDRFGGPRNEHEEIVATLGRFAVHVARGEHEGATKLVTPQLAEKLFQDARDKVQLASFVGILLGEISIRKKDWPAAIKYFEEYVSLNPTDEHARMKLACCHIRYSYSLQEQEKGQEAWLEMRAAEGIIVTLGIVSVNKFGFSGDLDAFGVPTGWFRLPYEGTGSYELNTIQEPTEPSALELRTKSFSVSVAHLASIDIRRTPVVRWEWKAEYLPPQGDVREDSLDDQACQVVIGFMVGTGISPIMLNYIWDTNAPTKTVFQRERPPFLEPMYLVYIVLRSGEEGKGEWIAERRNILDDLNMLASALPDIDVNGMPLSERLQDVAEKGVARFVAVQGNSQHTGAASAGVFRPIYFTGE